MNPPITSNSIALDKFLLVQSDRGQVLLCNLNTVEFGHMITEIGFALHFALLEQVKIYFLTDGSVVNDALLKLKSTKVQIIEQSEENTKYFKNAATRQQQLIEERQQLPFRHKEFRYRRDDSILKKKLNSLKKEIERSSQQYEVVDGKKRRTLLKDQLWKSRYEYQIQSLQNFINQAEKPSYFIREALLKDYGLHFSRSLEKKFEDFLTERGANSTNKFITLHVREAGYKYHRKATKLHEPDTRNASIANYERMFDLLEKKGFKILRVGDKSMTPIQHPAVIDLIEFDAIKGIEIFSIMKSELLIGVQSGPCPCLGNLLRKPCLILNCSDPIGSFPLGKDDRCLMKPIWDKEHKRFLTWEESLHRDAMNNFHNVSKYDYLENTPEEICEAVEEMLDLGNKKFDAAQQHYHWAVHQSVRSNRDLRLINKWGSKSGLMGHGTISKANNYHPTWPMNSSRIIEKLEKNGETGSVPNVPQNSSLSFTKANKILFFLDDLSLANRHYYFILEKLLKSGEIVLVYSKKSSSKIAIQELGKLEAKYPNLMVLDEIIPQVIANKFRKLTEFRYIHDIYRYADPVFKGKINLIERIRDGKYATSFNQKLFNILSKSRISRTIEKIIYYLKEAAIPTPFHYKDIISTFKPDLIIFSKMTLPGCQLVDAVKFAKQEGIKTVLAVASWDNLTNKGYIKICPDNVFVWNKFQKAEAIALHDVPANKLKVIGAPTFDSNYLFDHVTTGRALRKILNWKPEEIVILYLSSSRSIIDDEAEFIQNWIKKIRNSHLAKIKDAHIIIRPHPTRLNEFAELEATHFDDALLSNRLSILTGKETTLNDELSLSNICVGINTTAMIDASIFNKPTSIFLPNNDKRFSKGTSQTLHFEHLVHSGGGLVTVSTSLDDHLEQILQLTTNEKAIQKFRRKAEIFLTQFIRPKGITSNVTDIFIENLRNIIEGPSPQISLYSRFARFLQSRNLNYKYHYSKHTISISKKWKLARFIQSRSLNYKHQYSKHTKSIRNKLKSKITQKNE